MRSNLTLAEPESRANWLARLRRSDLAHLADRMDALAPNADPNELMGRVLGTRQEARKFIAAHPDVTGPVDLDAQWVTVITTPFVSELLKVWPEANFVNTNEDVAETIAIVRERLSQ